MANATRLFIVLLSLLFIRVNSNAQEPKVEKLEYKKHLISFSLGYAFVPKGVESSTDEEQGSFIPSLGLDYLYSLSQKWEIGVLSDVELGEYIILQKDLNREYVFVIAGAVVYKPTPKWSIFLGPGIEFEKHKNLGLLRVGTDYAINMGKDWIFAPTISYDIKSTHGTWALALTFGKAF